MGREIFGYHVLSYHRESMCFVTVDSKILQGTNKNNSKKRTPFWVGGEIQWKETENPKTRDTGTPLSPARPTCPGSLGRWTPATCRGRGKEKTHLICILTGLEENSRRLRCAFGPPFFSSLQFSPRHDGLHWLGEVPLIAESRLQGAKRWTQTDAYDSFWPSADWDKLGNNLKKVRCCKHNAGGATCIWARHELETVNFCKAFWNKAFRLFLFQVTCQVQHFKSSCADTDKRHPLFLKPPPATSFFHTFVCLSLFIWSPLRPCSPNAHLNSSEVSFRTSNGRTDIPEEDGQ